MKVTDKDWDRIVQAVRGRTMLEESRLRTFRELAEVAPVGDWAELGVGDGGVCLLLRELLPVVKGFGIDTFFGLPPLAGVDEPELLAGRFCSRADTAGVLRDHDVVIIQGVFPHSATEQLKVCRFSMVHLDADLYLSTRDALEFFWPRMVCGGFVVLDDWQRPQCPGVERAVKDLGLLQSVYQSNVDLSQLVLRKGN